jgi:uncharacterized protein
MIIYSESLAQFRRDVTENRIANLLENLTLARLGRRTPKSELASWQNSLNFVNNVLADPRFPEDVAVGLEYVIPSRASRLDVILTGRRSDGTDVACIIELKQWSEVEPSDRDGIVRLRMGGKTTERLHPSYQAWSYGRHLTDLVEVVRQRPVEIVPMAYLHNMVDGTAVRDTRYAAYLTEAPVYIQGDFDTIRAALLEQLVAGNDADLLDTIDSSKLSPSKSLSDAVVGMLRGNAEFVLIDDQKLIFEECLFLAKSLSDGKRVMIVRGGPGTGKSVIAINLLVKLLQQRLNVRYVSQNAAPRAVYERMLAGGSPYPIKHLFGSTGSFINAEDDSMDVLIVDEAHRSREKSGLYGNQGDDQIYEMIKAAKFTIFFVDDDQLVHVRDVGTSERLRATAAAVDAQVHERDLKAQFRCGGSERYIRFVEYLLGMTEETVEPPPPDEFDFRIVDSPHELMSLIHQKNRERGRARVVAGYCWPWRSQKDASAYDIVLPEWEFRMRWNLKDEGPEWLITKGSEERCGVIHTCQGLDLDYVGVIVGPDLRIRDGNVVTDFLERAPQDRSISGLKGMLKSDPERAQEIGDRIIRNTYRTLMTRGMKGCFVFPTDPQGWHQRAFGMVTRASAAAEEVPTYE